MKTKSVPMFKVMAMIVLAVLIGAAIPIIMVNDPPKVEVVCVGNNPVATITELPMAKDFSMQLVNTNGAATFISYNFTVPWAYDVIDGGIGDFQGSEYRELAPGWNLLWGWSDDNVFWPHKFSGFKFLTFFSVPNCGQ